jgi:hypothetical protein
MMSVMVKPKGRVIRVVAIDAKTRKSKSCTVTGASPKQVIEALAAVTSTDRVGARSGSRCRLASVKRTDEVLRTDVVKVNSNQTA